jgi:hypothetical protein
LQSSTTLLGVLSANIYLEAQEHLRSAKDEIALGLAATAWSEREERIASAISQCESARSLFGSNITFVLGAGNLMF